MYQAILDNIEGELWGLIDEMRGASELQAELADIPGADKLTIRNGNGTQIITINGRESVVPGDATIDEIRAAITKIPEKSKMALLKTQGVSAKLAKLRHDLEFDAGKLSDRIDSVARRKDAAFAKGHQFLDTTEGHIGEVEEFVKDLEAATNGGEG